ncbi:hypothetical protein [Marinithermofilum abyssi]|nr:hypothetical protein [Marinithermofilum abyssi]
MNLLRWAVGIFFLVVVMACQAYTVDAPALPESEVTDGKTSVSA